MGNKHKNQKNERKIDMTKEKQQKEKNIKENLITFELEQKR